MNLGAAAGNTHVHAHATPRYDREVTFQGEYIVTSAGRSRVNPSRVGRLMQTLLKRSLRQFEMRSSFVYR